MAGDTPYRVVFDTNGIIRGFIFPESIPGQAGFGIDAPFAVDVDGCSRRAYGVMRREKFDRYLSRQRREEVIAGIIRDSKFVTTSTTITVCRDCDDNKCLELAVDGGAAAIVSGDDDLLVLNPFRGISILTPREFLAQFAAT
jgi:putative PIN family toxin of toxin-antitoxin system